MTKHILKTCAYHQKLQTGSKRVPEYVSAELHNGLARESQRKVGS
jgi:hypothetical protein